MARGTSRGGDANFPISGIASRNIAEYIGPREHPPILKGEPMAARRGGAVRRLGACSCRDGHGMAIGGRRRIIMVVACHTGIPPWRGVDDRRGYRG